MYTEFEATFANIDKENVRANLKKAGAKLLRKEFRQRRVVFKLPTGHEIKGAWARVRDEGNRVTASLKIINGNHIEDQKEIQLVVDNFDNAVELLETVGLRKKAYQRCKKESIPGIQKRALETGWSRNNY